MGLRETVRAVAIVLNILALFGLAATLLLDSADDGPWLLPAVLCALISALAALLWPGSRRQDLRHAIGSATYIRTFFGPFRDPNELSPSHHPAVRGASGRGLGQGVRRR